MVVKSYEAQKRPLITMNIVSCVMRNMIPFYALPFMTLQWGYMEDEQAQILRISSAVEHCKPPPYLIPARVHFVSYFGRIGVACSQGNPLQHRATACLGPGGLILALSSIKLLVTL